MAISLETDTPTRERLDALFEKHGYRDYKWIDPSTIQVAQWVRMKCIFGCGDYGRNACCPPNVPTIAECERFFREYQMGVIFHFEKKLDKPEDRHAWSKKLNMGLYRLEREVFLSDCRKAFILGFDTCQICKECSDNRTQCKEPRLARPSPEALGIDVYATVRQYDYPIQVLSDYTQTMNRYAFLLVK